jgi:deazaflavin-dependent oxidoreductase (nitroreductase family)
MARSTPPVVEPSWLVRHVMRPMTRVLNPAVKQVAGRRYMPMAAVVHHVGRRSGLTYRTATGARIAGEHFVIPLTFGTESDWCRNLVAAGGGRIELKGRTFEVTAPVVCPWDAEPALVARAYPAVMRAMLRMLGIKAFMRLDILAVGDSTHDRSEDRTRP